MAVSEFAEGNIIECIGRSRATALQEEKISMTEMSEKQVELLWKIADKYGGWARILDPEFTPPEALYSELDAAGYPREDYEQARSNGIPERQYRLWEIAGTLYSWWFDSVNNMPHNLIPQICPGRDNGTRWQEGNTPFAPQLTSFWQSHLLVMQQLSISKDDVDDFIWANPDKYPPLSGGSDPRQPSGVPLRRSPSTGSGAIALPLPKPEET